MATLKEAIQQAKLEPTSERAQKLKSALASGKMDAIAQQEGIDLSAFKAKTAVQPPSIAATPAGPTQIPPQKNVVQNVGEDLTAGVVDIGSGILKGLGELANLVSAGGQEVSKAVLNPILKATTGQEITAPTVGIDTEEGGFKEYDVVEGGERVAAAGRQAIEGLGEVLGAPITGVLKSSPGFVQDIVGGGLNLLYGSVKEVGKIPSRVINWVGQQAGVFDQDIDEETLNQIGDDVAQALFWAAPIKGKIKAGKSLAKGEVAAAGEALEFAGKAKPKVTPPAEAIEIARKSFENAALRRSLPEPAVNFIRNLTPEQIGKQVEYLRGAIDLMKNPNKAAKIKGPMEMVGDEIVNIYNKVKARERLAGAVVGESKKALQGQKIVPKGALPDFWETMGDLNAKPSQGGVTKGSFLKSDIKTNAAVQNILIDIYKDLRKKNINARDLESHTARIDALTIDQAPGPVKTALNKIKTGLKKVLPEEMNAADDAFSFLKQRTSTAESAGGVLIKKGKKTLSGQKIAESILQKIHEKGDSALDAMREAAKKYRLKFPDDIADRIQMADLAEKLTETAPSRGFTGMVTEVVPGKINKALDLAQKAKQYIKPEKVVEGNALKILQEVEKLKTNIVDAASGKGKVGKIAMIKQLQSLLPLVISYVTEEESAD